ncbi:TetR family transcriptional regulator C-terminal domain-containing protein [Nocardia sp. NPDC004604]|uniref:TetR/AcrR family transcriptional regulator n=1 Tax=Nocardia sp. NPDC004604 TaxID=3157013 RepID=UPI00339EC4DB
MPKIVDHGERRTELAEAVCRVIARDGVQEVSVRTVAAEAGWSTGTLRYYFTSRAELLASACALVIERVSARIGELRQTGDIRWTVRAALLETMPLDERRRTEETVAFSFLALGLGDPALAAVQRTHFEAMYRLCRSLIDALGDLNLLADNAIPREAAARRLHAVVDGLALQGLARHLDPKEMTAQLDSYLNDLIVPEN